MNHRLSPMSSRLLSPAATLSHALAVSLALCSLVAPLSAAADTPANAPLAAPPAAPAGSDPTSPARPPTTAQAPQQRPAQARSEAARPSAPPANPQRSNQVAARVNGVPILEADVLRRAAGADLPADERESLLHLLVAEELLWQKVLRERPTRKSASPQERAALTRAHLERELRPAAVTEPELRAQYTRIVAALGPQEHRLSAIEFIDDTTLALVQRELSAGTPFEVLAQRHSRSRTAASGGELGWRSFAEPLQPGHTAGLPMSYAEAVLGLKDGEVSAPVRIGEKRWTLIRLEARRPTLVPAFDEVRATLDELARAQKINDAALALGERLARDAQIDIAPTPDASRVSAR